MTRDRTARLGLAALALVGLGALGVWAVRPGQIHGPARVEASAEYRVSHAGDGRVRWTLLDGAVPGGPAVVSDGVLQGDRGDPVEVERLAGLQAGTRVEAGAPVATVRSPGLDAEALTLLAEREHALAERDLLQAGGRADAVAQARQALAVAEAELARSRAEVEHLDALVSRGAEAGWVAEEARRELAVRTAEAELARAALAGARVEPRAEELRVLDARIQTVDAQLQAAERRQQGQALKSPIAGTVGLPGGDVLVTVQGDGPSMLQVAVPESDRDGLAPGAVVRFSPTATVGGPVEGTVVSVGGTAANLGGQPVVWVVASLERPLPVGATGTARILPGATR